MHKESVRQLEDIQQLPAGSLQMTTQECGCIFYHLLPLSPSIFVVVEVYLLNHASDHSF